MADGLQILGIDAQPTADGMIIVGGQLTHGEVETHDDHRIAMAFTMAGLRSTGPIVINNCAHVATSFPGFVELSQQAGIKIQERLS
jgi:5-enolpyruvylshikimate-3-phosphate synthase